MVPCVVKKLYDVDLTAGLGDFAYIPSLYLPIYTYTLITHTTQCNTSAPLLLVAPRGGVYVPCQLLLLACLLLRLRGEVPKARADAAAEELAEVESLKQAPPWKRRRPPRSRTAPRHPPWTI